MENDLIVRARGGDVDAFSTLVEQHTPGLYAFLYHRVSTGDLASDLTQETFIRAWRAIGVFRGDCSFRSWLYRIALHLAIDETSRQRRNASWGPVPDQEDPASVSASERMEHEAERTDVQAAMRTLPAEDQELLRQLYQEQLSYAEITDLSGLPLGTVKIKLHRARLRLRTHLERLWEVTR